MADLFLFRSPVGHIFILISRRTHTYIDFRVCGTELIHILIRRYLSTYSYLYGGDLNPIGYTDYDFQSDKDSRKLTFGSIFTLGGGAVVWRSIKQSSIADSTMEAEYIAVCEAAKESVWLKKLYTDLEVVPNMEKPLVLYCDNSGEVANSKEPRSHKRGKHIERKYHLIREIIHRGDIAL